MVIASRLQNWPLYGAGLASFFDSVSQRGLYVFSFAFALLSQSTAQCWPTASLRSLFVHPSIEGFDSFGHLSP